jgi:collagenase-like PrtC family protease
MMQAMNATAPTLTVGPLQYWWPREAVMAFYADVAESPAATVVLGEVVCSRRNDFKLADWLALGRELAAAGKEVVLATMPLVMSEAELRALRRVAEQDEFAVEAGDAAALHVLAQLWQRGKGAGRRPFVIGAHVNVYSRAALVEHAGFGAGVWVPPLELDLEAVARINPMADPVPGAAGPIRTEVFGFGRLPLAFSARCFTARHHRLSKDECDFRCRQDADGLLVSSGDHQPFLVLNGIQTQSAGVHCLIDEVAALRAAGAARVRLSPTSRGFIRVIELFQEVLQGALPGAEARRELAGLGLPGALVSGFARHRPGMEAVPA